MTQVLFIVISAVVLLAALAVVTLPNIFHAALALVLSLLAIAGLYALLGAGYVSVVQILVYVGAVSVLIIFGIMVSQRFMGRKPLPKNERWWAAGAVCLVLLLILVYILNTVTWPGTTQAVPADSVAKLGEALLGHYVLPFEVASLVLLASLIGAIYIARER